MPTTGREFTIQSVAAAQPGRHHAGVAGLYLHVGPNGTRRWVFRYTNPLTHRVTELGLGTTEAVGLGDARAQARHLQKLVGRGVDPIQAKRSGMPLATPERSPTF